GAAIHSEEVIHTTEPLHDELIHATAFSLLPKGCHSDLFNLHNDQNTTFGRPKNMFWSAFDYSLNNPRNQERRVTVMAFIVLLLRDSENFMPGLSM
ncbi:TPA: hypothetical protein J1063_005217, partial [Escherichia coli]|nr:hypothetical protein [Escherichia coli]